MAEQREKPGATPEQFEALTGQRPLYLSGGQIEHFRKGWAKNIDPSRDSSVAHYYRRGHFDQGVSLCGEVAAVRWLYGAGNYPRCRRCNAKARTMRLAS